MVIDAYKFLENLMLPKKHAFQCSPKKRKLSESPHCNYTATTVNSGGPISPLDAQGVTFEENCENPDRFLDDRALENSSTHIFIEKIEKKGQTDYADDVLPIMPAIEDRV